MSWTPSRDALIQIVRRGNAARGASAGSAALHNKEK